MKQNYLRINDAIFMNLEINLPVSDESFLKVINTCILNRLKLYHIQRNTYCLLIAVLTHTLLPQRYQYIFRLTNTNIRNCASHNMAMLTVIYLKDWLKWNEYFYYISSIIKQVSNLYFFKPYRIFQNRKHALVILVLTLSSYFKFDRKISYCIVEVQIGL